jgi:pimeloyl-ACP methyl ester carboxylesterase
MIRLCTASFALLLLFAAPAQAQGTCDPDGLQASGSIYRICMPPAGAYNGNLIVWAHGFQDAGEPVAIPESQLCFGGLCLPQLITQLGFGFATNSYSKTGLAVLQGKDDILDLVNIFTAQKGRPNKVYLIGASEGGLITALSLEQRPDVFSAGVAACGPVGNFPFQINYFGDARATFEFFFPGVIPGNPFNPDPGLTSVWSLYYDLVVKPIVFHPANRGQLDQWVRAAGLPFDPADYLGSVAVSVEDVLRYSVVNLNDAAATLGGFPFDTRFRWYSESDNDFLLNVLVPRADADPVAVVAMNTSYATTGVLTRPLITLHTVLDQQVPYLHEIFYILKTLGSGSFVARHLNLAVERFEHCNFTPEEAIFSLAVMLFYDGMLTEVTGTASMSSPSAQAAFERRARAAGLPYRRAGTLGFKLRSAPVKR